MKIYNFCFCANEINFKQLWVEKKPDTRLSNFIRIFHELVKLKHACSTCVCLWFVLGTLSIILIKRDRLQRHCWLLLSADTMFSRRAEVPSVPRIEFPTKDELYNESFYCAIKPGGWFESWKKLIDFIKINSVDCFTHEKINPFSPSFSFSFENRKMLWIISD